MKEKNLALLDKANNAIQTFLERMGDNNLFACDVTLLVPVLGQVCHIESIWLNKDENEYYLHINHPEAEGDIKVSSLPDVTIKMLIDNIEAL